jgi:hypothetical protein
MTARLAQFPLYTFGIDLTFLPIADRSALPHLLRAGYALEQLYLTQWWSGNLSLRQRLAHGDPKLLELFDAYKGPYGTCLGDTD